MFDEDGASVRNDRNTGRLEGDARDCLPVGRSGEVDSRGLVGDGTDDL